MGLGIDVPTDYGETLRAKYARILRLTYNKDEDSLILTVAVYVDKGARDTGGRVIRVQEHRVPAIRWLDHSLNPMPAAYDILKTDLFPGATDI